MTRKFLLAALLITVGCTGKQESAPNSGKAVAKVVNLFTWSGYFPASVVADFEKQTGIKIQISNFSSNEELLAKLQAGASGYDVIVPSDYMVSVMVKLGLLQELERSKISHWSNMDPHVAGRPYDPENKFSVPYAWTTTGIGINRDFFKGEIKGWRDLFENPALVGKFSLLDDVREVLGAALKRNGNSLNSVDPGELAKAKEVLMKARKSIRSFTSEPQTALINGEVAVAHIYSSDALQAIKKVDSKIAYVIPIEGATFCIDNLAIPKTAPHMAEAHAFIDFVMQAKVDAMIVQDRVVGGVVKGVEALLPKVILQNAALFPDAKVRERLEMIRDVGESTAAYDRIWTEVKAAL
jgi:spermidine/putrescine transport system substrate-binding protein